MDKHLELYSQILQSLFPDHPKDRIDQLLSQPDVNEALDMCIIKLQSLEAVMPALIENLESTENTENVLTMELSEPIINCSEDYAETIENFEISEELQDVINDSVEPAVSDFIEHELENVQEESNLAASNEVPKETLTTVSANEDSIVTMKKLSKTVCTPIFYLPNGKVGDEYSANVEIRSVPANVSIVIEKILSKDDNFTLKYDSITGKMEGMPTVAGSYALGVVWKIDGYQNETSNIEFIVNPDPNSLWKDLPSDESDRYFKKNEDHQYIKGQGCDMIAASRRGRSHAHIGSFRDDDFWMAALENGWNITIVSDGAGSAQNSRKGSALLVNCIGQFLQAQLLSEEHQNLVNQVAIWDDSAHAAIGKQFKEWFRDAAVLAVKEIEEEANSVGEPIKSYSSTALAAVTLKIDDQLFAATFWVGDGAMVAYSSTENVRVLGQVDSGEFAGQTRFLDSAVVRDPAFYDRIRIGKWQNIDYFLLMTDGISDPKFDTDAALYQTEHWKDLVQEIEPLLTRDEIAAAALLDWMKFPSPGHHDDRTFIVLW